MPLAAGGFRDGEICHDSIIGTGRLRRLQRRQPRLTGIAADSTMNTSCPHSAPSSRGLGHGPFKAATRVRIPSGSFLRVNSRAIEKETDMIELTESQRRELSEAEPIAIDPQTKQTYVMIPKQTYDRMKQLLYDDSPWTDEEMDLLAQEAGELLDEYRP